MLGSSVVKQYFSTNTQHKVIPTVSAEWNYNLFYAPYATFSGDGSQVYTNWNTPSSWTTTNCSVVYDTSLGKPSTVYTDGSALKFTTSGQNGSGTLTILPASGTSVSNAYKITFYAKTTQDVEVTLSALTAIGTDGHRTTSTSYVIDNTIWTKFEVYVTSLPTQSAYSSFNLTLDFTSRDTTMASLVQPAPSNYSVLIDQFEIFQTTDFDYQYGKTWPTSSPFNIFRPGESYVPSGNALTPLPTNFRQIETSFNNSSWNYQSMPCSPITYHPHILGSSNSNPLYKNGIVSDYTTYKYFVSDGNTNSLGALYDTLLATNKIVLKFNTQYSTPTSVSVNLYNTVTGYSRSISITNSDILNGVCIIYLQSNGTWLTTSQGGAWTTMPTFDNATGQITLYQNINKIVVQQNSASINSAYNSPSSDISNSTMNGVSYPGRYTQYQKDLKRLQVIEISPRIELDLSNFLVDISTQNELDNKQSPLPISAISSNNATINLTTIPLNISNQPLSIFSNNSSTSPLAGLFKQNVKIIINYVIKDNLSTTFNSYTGLSSPTSSDYVIPGGVYYTDVWNVKDLERVEVVAYDITKYLQLLSPTDYVSQSQDAFKIISNVLDFAGFTDYDYDSLRKVTLSQTSLIDGTLLTNKQPMNSSFYYVDGLQQKVFDVLRELFEVYQIGAYINSYGVMEFLSLDNILGNTTPNLLIHNNPTPQVITTGQGYTDNLTVTTNITEGTYIETIKSKIGKATLKYRIPQINKTLDVNGSSGNSSLETELIDKNDILWELSKDSVVTFNFLNQSIPNYSQNYFYLNPDDLKNLFSQFSIDQDGYAIIEGEIVSFKDKEFQFSITPEANPSYSQINPYPQNYNVIINSASQLQTAISDFSARAGFGGSISYKPTGKIANVERGMFNTPVRSHNIISNNNNNTDDSNSLYSKMVYVSGDYPTVANNQILMGASIVGVKNIIRPLNEESSNVSISPNDGSSSTVKDYSYKTFSCKMVIGPESNKSFQNGLGGGLVIGLNSGNPTYIEIRQDTQNKRKVVNKKGVTITSNSYFLYVYNNSGSLLGTTQRPLPYVEISSALLNDVQAYPQDSPFAQFGRTVNLKFVKLDSKSANDEYFKIYLNNHEISVPTLSTNIDTSGTYGIFSQTTIPGTSGSIAFTELYATQTPLYNASTWYHWELPSFANTLSSKNKTFELNYMMQTVPEVIGISYFDVQYNLAPALNARPVPSPYSWYYYVTVQSTKTSSLGPQEILESINLREDSLSYSNIYNSGFRGRFSIINSSPSAIWIKKVPDSKNPIDVGYLVNTNNLIALSNEVSIEKIFDPANISQSIEITSNWVQSESAALGILKNVFRANDGFSRDTKISVYANPLFEIGDVVTVNYTFKNIVNKKYFVQGVEQSFQDTFLTTLTLNELPNS